MLEAFLLFVATVDQLPLSEHLGFELTPEKLGFWINCPKTGAEMEALLSLSRYRERFGELPE
jgi:hypothetical protein